MSKQPNHLPLKAGCQYALANGWECHILEVHNGKAHGAVYSYGGKRLQHYASWFAESGIPVAQTLSTIMEKLPSWEDEFPWDIIHEDYKWASRDSEAARNGVEWEVWSECPVVLNTERGVIHDRVSKSKHAVLCSSVLLLPVPPGSGAVCIKRPE